MYACMNVHTYVYSTNLIKIDTSPFAQELSRRFKMMCLNTQSVFKKTTDICDHVMQANVDLVFCVKCGFDLNAVALLCYIKAVWQKKKKKKKKQHNNSNNITVSTSDFVFIAFEICEVPISLGSHTVVFLSACPLTPPPCPTEKTNWQMQWVFFNTFLIFRN